MKPKETFIFDHFVSIKKRDEIAEAMHKDVKVSIGTGNANSATIGAKIVMNLDIMLTMPMEVIEKSVGNIFGWATYAIPKAAVTPNLARRTRTTKTPSISSPMITIKRLATAETLNSPVKIYFGLYLLARTPTAILARTSAAKEAV